MVDHEADNDRTRTHVVLTQGTMVSHYRIVEKIGAGGMGEVYLAQDTKLDRKVALKFLPANMAQDPDVRSRFTREAQATAKLNHPNIVTIYEVSEHLGRPFFAMELVEGQSLSELSKSSDLGVDRIIEIAIQVCDGLGAAHDKEIVHRDIKPSNIVIDSYGRPKILDFGLAAIKGGEQLTKTGSTLGTVRYMSPEQVRGQEVDYRSDLFSLGAVLYELISGRTPFEKDNEGATLKSITQDNPEPLARYKADIPDELQRTVSKLLEKDPSMRYQTSGGVGSDLKRLMYDSQQTDYTRSVKSNPKKTGLILGGAAAVVVLLGSVLYFYFQSAGEKAQVEDEVPMIAVLPFENLGSPEDDYFADGMTEEIRSRLAGISGLGVSYSTSSREYKPDEQTLKEFGQKLGVDYALVGSVRWSASGEHVKVRITPQLIRVSDERSLWSKNYEQALLEVFAVQADIAEKIVEQLGLTLVESDKHDLANIPTEDSEAYQFYLKALQVYRHRSDHQGVIDARPLVDSAVAHDSTFALAHALRSDVYSNSAAHSPDSERGKIALESAMHALELQPGLPQGHLALGRFYGRVKDDNDQALEHYLLAKSGLENDALVLNRISSIQMKRGQFKEALANRIKVAELDPLNASSHVSLGDVLMSLRRFDEADQSFSRAIVLEPDIQYYYENKIESLIAQFGDIEKVRPVVYEALKHCDTTEFVIKNSAVMRFMPDLHTDSIITAFIQRQRVDTTDQPLFHDRPFFWFSHLNILEGRQTEVKRQLGHSSMDSEWFVGWRGLLLSFAGECEEAVKCGLRRKEFVSDGEHVDDLASTAMLMSNIYANCGNYDEAADEIEYALSLETHVTVNSLRLKHWIDPFRDHPKFQSLLEKHEKEHGL